MRRPGALIAACLLIVLMAQVVRGPLWPSLVYIAMGLVSALLYWLDKRAARNGSWRIQESTLHAVDFLGGIIGGLLAQEVFRHKTSKPAFRTITWLIAAAHALLLLSLAIGVVP